MPEKKRRLDSFKLNHPYCCLCGGKNSTESIEHAPPKIMFWDKQRSKGLEVPACIRCNHNSSQSDQVAAFYSIAQSSEVMEVIVTKNVSNFSKKLEAVALITSRTLEHFLQVLEK